MAVNTNQSYTKRAGETLDYTINWRDTSDASFTPYLQAGETISSSTWTLDSGVTAVSTSNTTTTTTIFVSGGTVGHPEYKLLNTIVTSAGRTAQRTITLRIVER